MLFALLHSKFSSEGGLRYGHILISSIIQPVVSTAFQIFCYDIIGGHSLFDSVSILLRISMLVIIGEFSLSLTQFTYLYGLIPVFLYNLVYIVVFEFGLRNDGDADIDYISWIILCILWHFMFTHLKNWCNYKWFTSQRIAPNVKSFQLLSVANDGNVQSDDEYCTLSMGSCVDQRKETMAAYQAMHREQADIVLLLGDNVYADLAPPTITKIKKRIFGTEPVFKTEYNILLNHKDFRPNGYDYSDQVWLALWDDHDYGENDAAASYPKKMEAKSAFVEFLEQIQINEDDEQLNAQIGAMKENEDRGTYYSYDYHSDIVSLRIVMLDARYDRAEDETDIIGEQQWNWLEQELNKESDRGIDWYLICNGSPVLNEGEGGKKTIGQDTRNKLFSLLKANDGKLFDKTILISGDLHYSLWHSVDETLYELTASSITHSKPWYCCKCWLKFLEIEQYEAAKKHNGNGATGKSEPIKKNSFGLLKINKKEFHFCVKDAFGYEYLNLSHVKK